MTAKVLVTFASEYNIPARDGQEATSGLTINYFFMDDEFSNFNTKEYTHAETTNRGSNRAKGSLDTLQTPFVTKVPAIYDADINYSIGSDGKPVIKLLDLKYVADVRLVIDQPKK